MATKTKMEKCLIEAEAIINAEADKIMSELSRIAGTLPSLRQSVADASDEVGPVAEVWDRIRSGEDVTASDLVTAEAQEKIDAHRLAYMTVRENSLRNRLPVETVELAERTAGVLRKTMQGFGVHVTRADPRTWNFPEGTTAIVVVARGPIDRDRYTGLISGDVTVLMHRPGAYRPINVEAFEATAKRERLSLKVVSNVVGDEGGWQVVSGPVAEPRDPNAYVVDTLTVRLEHVIDEWAVIPRVDLSGLQSRMWVEEVFRSSGAHPVGIPGTDKPWLWGVDIGRHTVTHGMPPEIVSESIDPDGIRTLVPSQVLHTFNTHPGDFAGGLGEAMRLDRGLVYAGLGTLIDSEVKEGSSNPERQIANWTILLTFESKTA